MRSIMRMLERSHGWMIQERLFTALRTTARFKRCISTRELCLIIDIDRYTRRMSEKFEDILYERTRLDNLSKWPLLVSLVEDPKDRHPSQLFFDIADRMFEQETTHQFLRETREKCYKWLELEG